MQVLASFYAGIVPQKLIEAEPGATLRDKAKDFAERPLGSGPFMITSWTHGNEFVLKRNPYYWKLGDDGKPLPYLDEIKVVVIPDDATRILKLKAGEIDAAEFVPFSRIAELKADPKLTMALFPAAKIIYLAMNNRPTLKDGAKNPLVRPARSPGAELRRREESHRPDHVLRGRHPAGHAAAVLHAAGDDRQGRAVPVRSGESQSADAGSRLRQRLRPQHLRDRRQRR